MVQYKLDAIVWNKDKTPSGYYTSETGYPEDVGHPLFTSSPTQNSSRFEIIYNSLYGENISIAENTEVYVADLPNTGSSVYIVGCTSLFDPENDKQPIFYECYLFNETGIAPVCSSNNACDTIKSMMTKLYKEINKSAKRIHISHNVISTIDTYLRGRVEEELQDQ